MSSLTITERHTVERAPMRKEARRMLEAWAGTNEKTTLPLQPDRLLEDLGALRQIGARGIGVARPAFSDADLKARHWLAQRMVDAGLSPVFDVCGNLFGMPPGKGPFLLTGSHTDSQPLGGWLDGVYGVLAGLEVARAALEAGARAPAVVSFQDEEGRFGHLTGSSVWSGHVTLPEADRFTDAQGVSFAQARQAIASAVSTAAPGPDRFTHFIEAHIEQGTVLDSEGEAVAAVTDIVGMRSLTLTLTGAANHAGTTPMHLRRDAVSAFAEIATTLETALPDQNHPNSVWTLGRVEVAPNASSIVPGQVIFDVQWRDASNARLEQMAGTIRTVAGDAAASRGLELTEQTAIPIRPTKMVENVVEVVAGACERVAPGRWRRMVSGALHDAANVSAVLPTAMLFVPSIGGISHNPDEDTLKADLATGLEVLASACMSLEAAR